LHRLSIAHAQENTGRLLEAVIDSVPRLELSGLEGDAAFLYVTEPEDEEISRSIADVAATMHRAFHVEQKHMTDLSLCACDACRQVGRLSVKLVAHLGDVEPHTTRGHTTLAGFDVILVHRMLKNSVPVSEYVLMTEPVFRRCESELGPHAVALEEELEGLGTQQLHYLDITRIATDMPETAGASWSERVGYTASLAVRTLPTVVGVSRSARSNPETEPARE
jgi:Protein of unknown function (DUF2652)